MIARKFTAPRPMKRACEADGCTSTSASILDLQDVHLVKFPKDERLPIWIENVKGVGSEWRPDHLSVLCTNHFAERFFLGGKKHLRILNNAIPTVNLGNVPGTESVKVPEPIPQINSLPDSLSCTQLTAPASPTALSPSASETSLRQREIQQPRKCVKLKSSIVKRGENSTPRTSDSQNKNVKLTRIKMEYRGRIDRVAGASIKKVHKQVQSQAEHTIPQAILDLLNVDKDDYLNKVLLRKCVKSLITHVDELCKDNDLDCTQKSELQALSFMLHKILKNMGLSPLDALAIFEDQIPDPIFEQLKRLIEFNRKKNIALIRMFSLSLHFYSVPAYSFVRNKMSGGLPHLRTIQAWYTSLDNYMY